MTRLHNKMALFALACSLVTMMPFSAMAQDSPTDDGGEPLDPSQCRPMSMIYKNGKDLCERIYGSAFKYVPVGDPNYALAYTMWFFTDSNPNDKTTQARLDAGLFPEPGYNSTDVCWLKDPGITVMRDRPGGENATFSECFPYRHRACCDEATVENSTVINLMYGPEYRWDRCGKLSPECERFFVQESCFYECDPNVGLFRKYTPKEVAADPSLDDYLWEIENMPIQGDYCDAWFQACREQLFCGTGDFFNCSKEYDPTKDIPPGSQSLSGGAIAGIVIGCVVLALTLIFLGVLIHNERRGHPMFQKINMEDSQPLVKPPTATPAGGATSASREDVTVI